MTLLSKCDDIFARCLQTLLLSVLHVVVAFVVLGELGSDCAPWYFILWWCFVICRLSFCRRKRFQFVLAAVAAQAVLLLVPHSLKAALPSSLPAPQLLLVLQLLLPLPLPLNSLTSSPVPVLDRPRRTQQAVEGIRSTAISCMQLTYALVKQPLLLRSVLLSRLTRPCIAQPR